MAQQRAIEAEAGLIIVESDVLVKKNTLQALFDGATERIDCGIAAAVTVDEKGEINYPYLSRKVRRIRFFPRRNIVVLLLSADFEFSESFRFSSIKS